MVHPSSPGIDESIFRNVKKEIVLLKRKDSIHSYN
jgi:hypothetical protein